jgi:hypothetical protein
MKSFCLPRQLLLMSIFRNEWVDFPHVGFANGEVAAGETKEYSRLKSLSRT